MSAPPTAPWSSADRHRDSLDGARLVFAAVLALWLLWPLLVRDRVAQDAIPYPVAGELTRDDPTQVYGTGTGDLFDLPPEFAARSCARSPAGTDCAAVNVAFVSPPAALPLAVALAGLPAEGAVLLLRFGAAVSLVGGMAVLWRRLVARTPAAAPYLAVTAVLVTPLALLPIALGQTSPLLFLSACLGIERARHDRRLAAAVGALWGLTVVLKVFPLVLAAVAVARRRGVVVVAGAVTIVALVLLGAALGPVHLWGDFLRASRALARASAGNPYNGTSWAVWHAVAPSSTGTAAQGLVALVGAVTAVALWWWGARRAPADVGWALASLLVLLVVPLVWWHYEWVAVAAVGLAVAAHPRPASRLIVLPVLAAVTVPLTLLDGRGTAVAVVQAAFLVMSAVGAAVLAREASSASEAVQAEI